MSRSRGTRVVLTGALLMVALAACGAPTPPPPGPPSSVAPAPSPSTADAAKEAALVAYRGMWADFVTAGVTSDWKSARLADHATGVALTNLSRGLYADQRNGLVTKGQPKLAPSVSSVEPAENPVKIVVTDCGDSSEWLKSRLSDGAPTGDSPGGRQLIDAVVEKQSDGNWKVSDFGVQAPGSC